MVATVTMVTSFGEMLSDSGFQKYLIQHEFRDNRDLENNANVAFWTNLCIAVCLWVLISLFRDELAALVGNPGLGFPLMIASFSLPLQSFSSIQLALYRREFRFKKLLPVRVMVALVPLFVTLPLALSGIGFWSLIIGTLTGGFVNAVALTVMSRWRPSLFYSFDILKQMFSFSGWSLLEAIAIWLTSWSGTFIVGTILSSYYLGLYKQPMTIVNSVFSLITTATTPVLFASLSRLQSDSSAFKNFYYKFQFSVGMFVLPLGIGIFLFRKFVTDLVLGNQWGEASLMLGAWGLSSGVMIVFSFYCSEVFRSLGKPKVSLFAQCLYMLIMVPTLFISSRISFTSLVIANAIVRLSAILINETLCYLVAGIKIQATLKRLRTPLTGVFAMACAGAVFVRAAGEDIAMNLLAILGCAVVYFLAILVFEDGRHFIKSLVNRGLTSRF